MTGNKNALHFRQNADIRKATKQQVATLTIEADSADVSEQLLAVDVGHAGAKAGVAVAKLTVHPVEGVSHGVHGVHHELDFALLLIAGVASHLLQACETGAGGAVSEGGAAGRKAEVDQVKWVKKKGIFACKCCR